MYDRQQRRRDPRRADLLGGAGRRRRGQGRRRSSTSTSAPPPPTLTGKSVQQVHVPLRLRHLDAGQRHRHRGHRGRRARTGTSSTPTTPSARTCRSPSPPRSRPPAARSSASDPTPFPNDNFSTFLLKAPTLNPKPDVLGTMQAGGDLVNLVKQYNEFKLRDKGIGLAVGLMFITDIHSLGADALAGTTFTDAWYWNFDAAEPRLGRPVPGQDRHPADVRPRGQLLGGDAVPRGGAGGRHRRRRRGRQAARGQEGQRRLPAQRQDPRRGPPRHPRRVPGRGEAGERGQRAVGLREDRQDHPGRRRYGRSDATAA